MDDRTRTAAGIAAQLQGLSYDEKRLSEIATELVVERKALGGRRRHSQA